MRLVIFSFYTVLIFKIQVIDWAKRRCESTSLMDVLEDILPHIRFRNLNAVELAAVFEKIELLEETVLFNLIYRAVDESNLSVIAEFAQINSKTKEVASYRIRTMSWCFVCSLWELKKDSKVLEVTEKMVLLNLPAPLEMSDVTHIIPFYTDLSINLKILDIKILTFLCGPKLKRFTFFGELVYENDEVFRNFVDVLKARKLEYLW